MASRAVEKIGRKIGGAGNCFDMIKNKVGRKNGTRVVKKVSDPFISLAAHWLEGHENGGGGEE